MQSSLMEFAVMARPVACVGFALALVAGCAAPSQGGSASREEVVRERAQQRWDALVAGDLDKAYGFLSPATRQVNSLANYSSSVRAGFWKKATVERVECREADLCDVHLTVEYARGGTIATPLRESWSQAGGQWWYVMK
jgi:hypothetical protein